MIRILLLLFLLAAMGIGAAWFAENPGNVVIRWFDYRIDTSFAFLFAVALLAAVLLAYVCILVNRLLRIPVHFSERRSLRHYQKGLTELTYSVAALASSDTKNAELHTRKAEKLLGRTPLTLLLSAQVARSQGNDEKTRLLLEQMLAHEETEYLAARSLSESASKQHLYPKALSLAERAQAINARGTDAVIGLHLKLGQWQEALNVISKGMRKGKLTRGELKRYRGIIYLQQGKQLLEMHQEESALYAARQALKNLPDFAPAIAFAAKAYAAAGKKRASEKLLKKIPLNPTWTCRACGHETGVWDAHCPSCETFDTLS